LADYDKVIADLTLIGLWAAIILVISFGSTLSTLWKFELDDFATGACVLYWIVFFPHGSEPYLRLKWWLSDKIHGTNTNLEAGILSGPKKEQEQTFARKANEILASLAKQGLKPDRKKTFTDDLLGQVLYNLPYSPWKLGETKQAVLKIAEFMEKELPLSDSSLRETLLLRLQAIIEKGDKETYESIRKKFLPIIEDYYEKGFNEPSVTTSFNSPVILDLLQRFNGYSFEIMKKLVDDALRKWSEETYKKRASSIALTGKSFLTDNRTGFLKIVDHLHTIGTDPNEKESVSNRAFEWYNLLKGLA